MTIGQRIAQKRKELSLSQEALGGQLGVSRQSIYKWESDAAVPEIDKLIALSRLFGVSVGWLLGVEEASVPSPDPAAEEAAASGELTEAQLKMVEEIVGRYIASQPKPHPRRRWPFVLAVMVLLIVFLNLFQSLNALRQQQESIFNNISQVESSVDRQIGSISNQVEEILKAQNSLVADYGVELLATTPAHNTATFSIYVVPKTYVEGMTVEFIAENGEVASDRVAKAGETGSNQCFSADLPVPLTDSITISALLISPDGTRQTQLLDQFYSLYSDTMPAVDVSSNFMWMDLEGGALVLTQNSHERYLWTREQVWSDNVTTIAQVRVGLFLNRELAAWAEPCEQPSSFQGFEDCSFYCLPELRLDLTAQDTIEVAAVVTDEYGRTTICQETPYVPDTETAELVHPDISSLDNNPANWHY